jgi:magnesium transporter
VALREVLNALYPDDTDGIWPGLKAGLRGVADPTMQVMDSGDSCREMAASRNDLDMSVVSSRMSEAVKVRTITASFFMPITFMGEVYGMNSDPLPELH